ncbi:MAG: guanylate kinase [Dethiobacter sp.]|nr:guanylate kinase [Dethiobacter sp.]MBS3897878.1 guanylate kinase [Dethiobacter sp.]
MSRQGLLIVVSGPSGAGKGTVCRALLDSSPELVLSVSKTTREPRTGEQDGVNYFFVTHQEFEQALSEQDFLEHACVYGQYYGTPRSAVEKLLAVGSDVILEIDTQGAIQVMEACAEGIFIFLLPPSGTELRTRIINRGTESLESLQRRLAAAAQEVALAPKYDYIVVNDRVEDARDRIFAIIQAEKLRTGRNRKLIQTIAEEVKA